MSTVTRPRGPLPSRVYWRRRLVLLVAAIALVFGVGHLLGGSPDGSANPSARPAAAPVASASTGQTPQAGPTRGPALLPTTDATTKKPTETPLADPTGSCTDSDVIVTPSVDGPAYAGHDVTVTLNLTAVDSPACTWKVSPRSVVVKLTSGNDRIWSTQDCPGAVKRQSVVVRKDHVTKVGVTWSGQRSDEGCTRTTPWAQPGYYHAEAAALGSEPQDQQFQPQPPTRPTITAEPKVKKEHQG